MSWDSSPGPLLLVLVLAGCAQLSAGREYTLAKVGADQESLMPASFVVHDGQSTEVGTYDREVGDHLGIVLNGGYLRYLESVDRPEVLIYVRTRIFPKDLNAAPVVWEKIYLQTEDPSEQMLLTGDSFLPRRDIPVLPSFRYNGEDVQVSLRIIELDQDDNERIKQMVNTAASTTATFQPQAAPAVSVAQTVLSFLAANNSDDIEFQFDFGISPSGEAIPIAPADEWSPVTRIDTVLKPRVAKFVILKTEHRKRLVVPSNYFDAAEQSVRYLVAQALKIGTLGLFNWNLWESVGADQEDDVYLRLLGRPFAIDGNAWRLPDWYGDRLTLEKRFENWYLVADRVELRLKDDRLVQRALEVGENPTHYPPELGDARLFTDQGYLLVTVTSPEEGVDLNTLREAAEHNTRIDSLVRTGQMTPEEFGREIETLGDGLKAAYALEQAQRQLTRRLRSAGSAEEIQKLYEEFEAGLRPRLEEQFSAAETRRLLGNLEAVAGRRFDKAGGRGAFRVQARLDSVPFVGVDGDEFLLLAQVPLNLEGRSYSIEAEGLSESPEVTEGTVIDGAENRIVRLHVRGAGERAVTGVLTVAGTRDGAAFTSRLEVTLLPATEVEDILAVPDDEERPESRSWQTGEVLELKRQSGAFVLGSGDDAPSVVDAVEFGTDADALVRLTPESVTADRIRVVNSTGVDLTVVSARVVLRSEVNRVADQEPDGAEEGSVLIPGDSQ